MIREHLTALAAITLVALPATATIVRFETTLGDIDVRMFDTATPQSVANFLNYASDGDFVGSFFHRAPKQVRRDEQGQPVQDGNGQFIFDTFVVQGGGFGFTDAGGLTVVPTDQPVVNEPGLSNLPWTIAYAKQANDPNSATSGFFFNTVDNSANLDFQNEGFTVFARVVRGQSVLDSIAALDVFDLDPAPDPTPENPFPENPPTFDDVPLLNIPASLEANMIRLTSVSVLSLSEGDYDFDGDVDLADLAVWQSQFGASLRIVDQALSPRSTLVDADGNGDGVVDASDYTVWRNAFASSAATAVATPEPSALLIASIGSLAFAVRRGTSA